MSVRRRWTATCDAPGCDQIALLEGDQFDGKWALGEQITDDGWQASPAVDETFCPRHSATDGGDA